MHSAKKTHCSTQIIQLHFETIITVIAGKWFTIGSMRQVATGCYVVLVDTRS